MLGAKPAMCIQYKIAHRIGFIKLGRQTNCCNKYCVFSLQLTTTVLHLSISFRICQSFCHFVCNSPGLACVHAPTSLHLIIRLISVVGWELNWAPMRLIKSIGKIPGGRSWWQWKAEKEKKRRGEREKNGATEKGEKRESNKERERERESG